MVKKAVIIKPVKEVNHISTQDAILAKRSLQSLEMYGDFSIGFTFKKVTRIKTFKVKCNKRGLSRKVNYRYLSAYLKQLPHDEFHCLNKLPPPDFKQDRKWSG